ncbi:SubName: Full=Uncharacterized protein {ECO:0000313/EMBL:CCA74919.1} [Serendipita indica DSM 11827]|uniref:F-box domain-containing protein n=1 Tax=Serendipita indica (strain DSM 11827) TaxID=1109443 RepID=G4TUC6_SERID|nr:SubName: Full=Uncharacterized protein {ECO:0000313/EMBL:CCA74919.1} [Serendipita indica DSM 11827]CCA74919.1 hypothetical protein PIIN_08889 [Serendipita indica DSM 11827]
MNAEQSTPPSKRKADRTPKVETSGTGHELHVETMNTKALPIPHPSCFDHPRRCATARARRASLNLLTMPVEILAMILDEYHLMDLPLTLLMTACRTLNEVIKNTPRLWRRILISLDSMPPSLKAGSTMACATEKFLQTCIQRARNSPLEATLVVGRINESSPTPEFRRARFQMLMSRSSQISFLCLIINPDTPLHVIKDSFHGLFNDSTAFPALESLMITSALPIPGLFEVFHPLLDQLERTTVKLRSLYLGNMTRDFILAAREYKIWRKLRKITIKGNSRPFHVTIFEGCEHLEHLDISNKLLGHPSYALEPPNRGGPLGILDPDDMDVNEMEGCASETISQSRVSLRNLRSLRVGEIAMSGLQELHMPKLRHLVIQSALPNEGHLPHLPEHSISLPSLQVLHAVTSHSEINAISAPELHTLCLKVTALKRADADSIVSSIFHGGEGIWTPINLELHAPIHDKQYEEIYRRLPQIETLKVTLTKQPSDTFYKAIKKRGILPNLLRLVVKLEDDLLWSNSASTAPQMRTVRHLLDGGRAPMSIHNLHSREDLPSSFTTQGVTLPWSNTSRSRERNLPPISFSNSGYTSTFLPLSERVRPAMVEVVRVRTTQQLPFAFFSCHYAAENLTEIYAENNICHICRQNANPSTSSRRP